MSTSAGIPTGRLSNGRFAAGNAGGPGNPQARQTARFKQAMVQCLTEEVLLAVLKVLIDKAREGNVPAIRLVLQYALGKPDAVATGEQPPSTNGVIGDDGVTDAVKTPSPNGPIGESESAEPPIANGAIGEPECKVPPSPNGAIGDTECEGLPLTNGAIGETESKGPAPGQKLSSRVLRKLRKAARRDGQPLPRR